MAFPDKNYVLGSGELYFAPFAPGTRVPLAGQEYFGNTTEVNLTVESEMLDHYDTDHGIRQKDDSVLLEKNMSGSFITDHISPKNIAKWFTGTSSVVTQVSALASAETFDSVVPGGRYQIGRSPTNPSGLRGHRVSFPCCPYLSRQVDSDAHEQHHQRHDERHPHADRQSALVTGLPVAHIGAHRRSR